MKKHLVSLLALLGIHQHLSAEQRQDIAGALYQASPGAVTAGGFRIAGLPLSDWLVLVTIAFVILQACNLVWKWRRDYRREVARNQLSGKVRDVCMPDDES